MLVLWVTKSGLVTSTNQVNGMIQVTELSLILQFIFYKIIHSLWSSICASRTCSRGDSFWDRFQCIHRDCSFWNYLIVSYWPSASSPVWNEGDDRVASAGWLSTAIAADGSIRLETCSVVGVASSLAEEVADSLCLVALKRREKALPNRVHMWPASARQTRTNVH